MNILRIGLLDIKRILKDKMSFFWMLVMPLIFVFSFGGMFRDPHGQRTWIPVINLDGHELSEILVDELKQDKFDISVRSATDEQYVQYWSWTVIIPATFTVDLMKGEQANITFAKGKGNFQHTLAAQALVVKTITRMVGALAAADVVESRWTENTKERFLQELHKEPLLQVKNTSPSSLRPPPIGTSFTLPSYLIMFVMMNSVMFGGITLAMERKHKQLMRLSAAPNSVVDIIAGKMLGRLMAPFIQAFLLLWLGNLCFGVPLGDHPIALIPILVCFAMCCGTIGLTFGALFETEQQIAGIGMLFVMVASALGGCWWPLEVVPESFKTVAQFFPTYWGLRGLTDIMSFGKSFDAIIFECSILLGFSILFAAIAIPNLQRKAF